MKETREKVHLEMLAKEWGHFEESHMDSVEEEI